MRIYRHHLYEGGSQEYLKELNVSAHENTESEGMNHLFSIVGIQKPEEEVLSVKKKWHQGRPVLSWAILLLILLGCLFCDVIITKDPTYMDLMNYNLAPNREFLFGTDTMGRDIFSMIWYGGRISLFIGLLSTVISTAIAVVFGGISGIAPQWLDTLLMRLTEILLSVPNLLLVILLQAILGKPNVVTISVVIGVTSWTSIAKIVRTEVRQIRNSEYAIVSESTLSFMGIGLPLEIISWGSMLSLSEKALLTGSWWIILILGIFLVVTLLCMTAIGNDLRRQVNQKQSNL